MKQHLLTYLVAFSDDELSLGKYLHIKRNVMATQAYGCWLCLHIGDIAIFLGRRKGYGIRVELFTPLHKWRLSWRAAFEQRRQKRSSI